MTLGHCFAVDLCCKAEYTNVNVNIYSQQNVSIQKALPVLLAGGISNRMCAKDVSMGCPASVTSSTSMHVIESKKRLNLDRRDS